MRTSRSAAHLVWGLWTICVLLSAIALVLLRLNWQTIDPSGETIARTDVLLFMAFVSFPTMGTLILVHRPDNRIGWIFCLTGIAMCLWAFSKQYAVYGGLTSPDSLPLAEWAAWFADWLWVLALFPPMCLLFLLFPDGHLVSSRWRPVPWLLAASVGCLVAGFAFWPGDLGDSPFLENPAGIPGSREVLEALQTAGFLGGFATLVASVASLVLRMRRSRGIERQQLKLITFSAAMLLVTILGLNFLAEVLNRAWISALSDDLADIAIAAIPVAVGVSVLRYRLYDIDRIINRTLVYGALTAGLALVYFGLVVGLEEALSAVSGGSDLAIVVTTLVVAALFLPARARVQAVVDRRFNRRQYDAVRTVDAFSARLREQIELDALRYELLAVVDETMAPATASVWLRSKGAGA